MSLITINLTCDNAAVLAAIADLKEKITMTHDEEMQALAATSAALDDIQGDINTLLGLVQGSSDVPQDIADAVTALAAKASGIAGIYPPLAPAPAPAPADGS